MINVIIFLLCYLIGGCLTGAYMYSRLKEYDDVYRIPVHIVLVLWPCFWLGYVLAAIRMLKGEE